MACTDFRLKAADGTILITRSMEFGENLQSNLRTSTRGRIFHTTTPKSKPGLSWTAKYGYVYVDGFHIDAAFDGMNETGLTFEYLYLPGETHYQTIPDGEDGKAVPYSHFGDWVLSNFKSIDEVTQAINKIYVSNEIIPEIGNVTLPAHASIYDASGRGIVIEFYNEKINVYENIGVMTNSPKYDWHVTNLRNYINLSPVNPDSINQNGFVFSALGQGSGAVGLPGDASPASRFVKVSFMLKNLIKPQNAMETLGLAQHVINNVDLPAGFVRSVSNGQTVTDTTQWVVFKDITHKMFYYRTYDNMTLRAVAFNKLDFSNNAALLKMPLSASPHIVDVNEQFKKAISK
jgi:choloylglycine hydrolase